MERMGIIPIPVKEDVTPRTDLARFMLDAIRRQGQRLQNKDIIVIAHKIVSKAEDSIVDLASITPSRSAVSIARRYGKDPRIIEVILRESKRIVRMQRGIIITETRHGFVCANAGVDRSNVNGDRVAILPRNPDASARRIRKEIERCTGKDVTVIISDTFGRPFREGQVNVAIGVSGMNPIRDYRGKKDMFGKELKVTQIAVADEIASAAELVMGKLSRIPIAIVRGFRYSERDGSAAQLIRKRRYDLFR